MAHRFVHKKLSGSTVTVMIPGLFWGTDDVEIAKKMMVSALKMYFGVNRLLP